jgi:hypothetical protein
MKGKQSMAVKTLLKRSAGLILAGGLTLVGMNGAQKSEPSRAEGKQLYEVVWPLSKWGGKSTPPAPRLDTLGGKNICELGGGVFNSDKTFPILERFLREKYPDLKFTKIEGFDGPLDEEAAKLGKVLKEKGCQAVLTGNGC